MAGSFDSPKRLIARAKRDLDELDREVKSFIDGKPYATVVERDGHGIYDLHKIKLTRCLPAECEEIAFDATTKLRSALDQAGYASGCAGGKVNPKRTCFPIADSAANLETDVIGRGNCKDIPPEILTLFRSFRPYKGGNDLVWVLNRVANADKHRIIVPIGTVVGALSGTAFVERGSFGTLNRPWDNEKNEIVFAKSGRNTQFEYNFKFSILIAFGTVDGAAGQPAMPLLRAMMNEVECIILATEAETRRLGLIK